AARALPVARGAFARGDGDGDGGATVGVPRRQPGAAHERPSGVPVARVPRGGLDSTRE
ncbi:MAG: hypothetical protein HY908_23845, partial [Myxococcales bacterium]|nr:hypothetical protein [Myxococcales bacterium]